MQRLLKKNKKLWMMLLIAGVVTSCVSNAPRPPVIQIHIHDEISHIAKCASSDGDTCPAVPMEKTGGWFMLAPKEWQSVQDYVDTLVCIIDGGCQGTQGIQAKSRDLKYYAEQFKDLRAYLEYQRSLSSLP